MSGAIAIFAKTHGLTPAKTRLAAGIGAEGAARFYALSLDAVEAGVAGFLETHPDWLARWAVAEEEGVNHDRWRGFGARYTGPGNLGERMWRVYEGLRRVHGQAFLIGTDAPQMTPAHLETAVCALGQVEFVLGPAADGGFWLAGGRRAIPKAVWTVPRYSTRHALADLEAALAGAGLPPPAHLETLTDVDEVGDLACLAAEMPDTPTQAQRALLTWLGGLRSSAPHSA